MATLFFCFLAFMLAAYAVLDGYDLGTGILHLRLAGDDAERRQLLRTIGPLWDGNEVFLVAAGGTLFFAFPTLYATSFSGFYLPLIMVLWLLVLRGVSIDLRSHLGSPLWRTFFDAVFSLSSALLAFFLGVALGNVVRGVPIGPGTTFFQPLWDLGPDPGILDGYTVLVGATVLATLALQGAAWATYRTTGAVHDRARGHVRPLWIATGVLTAATTAATWAVQSRVPEAMLGEPWRLVFPAAAVVAFVATAVLHRQHRHRGTFLATSAFIFAMVTSAAAGLYPWMLPSSRAAQWSLAVHDVAAAEESLRIGAVWWPIGMAFALGYTVFVHRRFSGRERAE